MRYISETLHNPGSARELADAFIAEAEKLTVFPYSMPLYIPTHGLRHEYRTLRVHNYLMFYTVDETEKIITIVRVIYARRDYHRLLLE